MITTARELPSIRSELANKRIVFTVGSFDIVHAGHVAYLEWCAEQGDVLVVGVCHDRAIRRAKGPLRPIMPQQDRLRLIEALGMVDIVVPVERNDKLLPHEEAIHIAQKVQPEVAVLGHDWGPVELPDWQAGLTKTRIIICPLLHTPGRSTTDILKAIVAKYGVVGE